jgi:non-heme chloroperoxidase
MPTISTNDGARIFYKDWGSGQPIVFRHGWPLNADAWDDQLFFLASNGFRAIAHDRRGHGRSTQTRDGNDIDTYADDLAALAKALDLHNAIHVGHSTGGGEVVRYLARHGTKRVAGAVLVDAIPPLMLKTADNPEGIPMSEFDKIRSAVIADRSQFWKDLSFSFFGANRPNSTVSEGVRDAFWLMSMQAGMPAAYDCIKAFSETDFRQDLPKIDVPTLVIHGDDDQIVPLDVGGARSSKMIRGATLKVYQGGPHGVFATHKNQLNADLLTFAKELQSESPKTTRRTTDTSAREAPPPAI